MELMSPELLGRLIDSHAAALVLYARQWCASADDVVQDAFIKLAGLASPPSSAVSWLFRVVRNGAISAARSERRRRHHESVAASRTPAWLTAPADAALDAEFVAESLRELPQSQREVIIAHLWGGLTFEQIGETIGCSSSSAHRFYVAGLSALRERLKVPCPKTST
jgi:RNA polymerase sigma-70 factor (ECF subfamily)